MSKTVLILISIFLLCNNAYSLNIHREQSSTYSDELKNQNSKDKDEDEDIFENMPILPIKNNSSENYNLPFLMPGATFNLPNKK